MGVRQVSCRMALYQDFWGLPLMIGWGLGKYSTVSITSSQRHRLTGQPVTTDADFDTLPGEVLLSVAVLKLPPSLPCCTI